MGSYIGCGLVGDSILFISINCGLESIDSLIHVMLFLADYFFHFVNTYHYYDA